MPFYRNRVLPRLIHAAMGQAHLVPYRRRLLEPAAGRVLEIGVGSGLNLPHYPRAVSGIVGLDVSPALLARARRASAASDTGSLEILNASAEDLPIASGRCIWRDISGRTTS